MELHLHSSARCLETPLTLVNSMLSISACQWRTSCILFQCLPLRGKTGWRLTTLFGNTAVMPIAAPKTKRSLMPLLTVVFLASYGLMTLLIVEQGRTIQSQRNLIQVLAGDSTELWALKGKALHDKQMTKAQAQGQNQTRSLTKSPTTQGQAASVGTPSTQTQSTQTPSTQVPLHHSQSRAGKMAKPQTQVPPMPASDLGDRRRALITL